MIEGGPRHVTFDGQLQLDAGLLRFVEMRFTRFSHGVVEHRARLVVSLIHFAVQHSRLGVRALTVKAGVHATALVEIQGPIFFASHGQLEGLNSHDAAHPLLLDLRQVPTVDLTGADAVRGLLQQLSDRSVRLALVANRPDVTAALVDVGVAELLAGGRIYPTVDEALEALHTAYPSAARTAPPSFQLTIDEPKNHAGAA